MGIGFLVVALVTGGATEAAELTQPSEEAGQQLLHDRTHFEENSAPPLERAPLPLTQPSNDSVAVISVVEAILHLTEQILDSAPPVPVSDPISALVTHYGESYNGLPLGCGYGVYSSEDLTIVAVSPALYGEMPCGTLIEVCGPGGCVVGARKDACPGCTANVFDLSEAGFSAVRPALRRMQRKGAHSRGVRRPEAGESAGTGARDSTRGAGEDDFWSRPPNSESGAE